MVTVWATRSSAIYLVRNRCCQPHQNKVISSCTPPPPILAKDIHRTPQKDIQQVSYYILFPEGISSTKECNPNSVKKRASQDRKRGISLITRPNSPPTTPTHLSDIDEKFFPPLPSRQSPNRSRPKIHQGSPLSRPSGTSGQAFAEPSHAWH